jgi:hypothetical protein
VFVNLLRTVTCVKVTGNALIFEDDCPRNSGGIGRQKSAAWSKGKRLHISHDTLEDAAVTGLQRGVVSEKMPGQDERQDERIDGCGTGRDDW